MSDLNLSRDKPSTSGANGRRYLGGKEQPEKHVSSSHVTIALLFIVINKYKLKIQQINFHVSKSRIYYLCR